MIASGFSWWNVIPAFDEDAVVSFLGTYDYNLSIVTASAWMACFFVIAFAVVGRMSLNAALAKQGMDRFEADEGLSPRTLVELMGSFIRNLMADCMPKHEVKHYSAYIATLFLYILFCNLQGLVPGLLPPTDNINANVGMALASFLVFMWVGLSRDAAGFIKHLMGPLLPLAILMFPLESLSLLLRPLTLSLRLTGNMFGDHMVFTIMSDLSYVGVPALLLGLATFVSFMQAFVFSLLSAVYIGLSMPHESHDHH